ncbi:MAG: DUF3747 domain-containing protein [Leptolyngbyaceae cyanobacterium MO_188.B28]|nr:DUF3747 domain-containing protein [Leptolyngbyaceae cyanobacterium MO_188.B28]
MTSVIRSLFAFAATATALLGSLGMATSTQAYQFGQQELNPEQVIAIAEPIRNGQLYKLLILEQISNVRPCWQERPGIPTTIDPLLLNFDFTGICGRRSDSNGYSLRLGGEDLDGRYRLQIVQRGGTLVLLAVPARDRNSSPLEIGRSNGVTTDLAKIELNAGWRMTRRLYNGQPVGHIYLTHDQDLNTLIATASTATPSLSAPPPVHPLVENQPPSPAQPSLESLLQGRPNRNPPPLFSANSGLYYRLVVPANSPDILERVHAIEPGAFRNTVNGQAVIQAGIFRQRPRAVELQQRLSQANLSSQIIQGSGSIASNPNPVMPRNHHGQTVVMIDPGHGGRDPGAVGIGGLQEKVINLAISRRIQQVLQQRGVTAILTRTDDREIDLDPRVSHAERANADLFVSIHSNAISLSRPDVNGLETYYYDTGYGLAQSIHNTVLQRTGMLDRGLRQSRFYVLLYTPMPAVLVETGFVTGQEDAARFRNPSARDQIADAIAEGILNYIQ